MSAFGEFNIIIFIEPDSVFDSFEVILAVVTIIQVGTDSGALWRVEVFT
jgi:hypothetical protein